jgi:hypothetical protein
MPPFTKIDKTDVQPAPNAKAPEAVAVVANAPTQPDVVVIGEEQFYVGCPMSWPRRSYDPADADRMDQTLVETVELADGVPVVTLRSLVNGQTARIVGLACGQAIYYSPAPKAEKGKNAAGADIEVFPVPAGCVREGNDIKHAKFAKK